MYQLSDVQTIKSILKRHGFSFSKGLGQNFLIDPAVCPGIAKESGIHAGAGVIEIGAGIGVLTAELAKRAKKVVSFELDSRLSPILRETLADFDNVTILHKDIMDADIDAVIAGHFAGMPVYVCANLPYYITSPIIMKFLEGRAAVHSLTLMVQSEAAARLCAAVGSREAGAVSVAVSYFAEAERLFFVPRTSFLPSPSVDSEVIRLTVREQPPVSLQNEEFFFQLVKAAFAQRRKTAQNGISAGTGIEKPRIAAAFAAMGLDESIRAERLTLSQLAELSNVLYEPK
ncbi:MAG: 16S rRNA (adenine(1518)-N(6)/adenine(1519)-N(6))-dimethyltransferase RsmA [Oscillospiraceae bacterium]|nr:16S rRNA (adenine(1518)-N(6)/adenine(1519)-N(6))-dimethyltransferase RsmA [Oscillospiraceae bacterium]